MAAQEQEDAAMAVHLLSQTLHCLTGALWPHGALGGMFTRWVPKKY